MHWPQGYRERIRVLQAKLAASQARATVSTTHTHCSTSQVKLARGTPTGRVNDEVGACVIQIIDGQEITMEEREQVHGV